MGGQKIRVLQLIDCFAMGGAERVVLMLAKHLDPKRYHIIPCALHNSGPLEDEFKAAGLEYRILGLQRRSVLTGPLFWADMRRMLSTLSDVLTTLSIDIVHSHLNHSSLVGIRAARQTHTHSCTTVHNILLTTERGKFSLREWLMRAGINRVYSQADRVIAVSDEVAEALRVSTRIPLERIVTIPNGVDGDRFQLQEDKQTLRRRLQLPGERPILISVGRLTRQKGFPYLLDALAHLSPEERPLTLIVGDGPDRQALESKAAEMNVTQDVRFLGNRCDVPALLMASDCFVLASLWEGLPLALLEAMASGLPVIVTAVGGNPTVLEHGESGLLVAAADAVALAQALRHMLRNPCQRADMGHAAQKRFEQRFSLQRFIDAHESVYQQMVR